MPKSWFIKKMFNSISGIEFSVILISSIIDVACPPVCVSPVGVGICDSCHSWQLNVSYVLGEDGNENTVITSF